MHDHAEVECHGSVRQSEQLFDRGDETVSLSNVGGILTRERSDGPQTAKGVDFDLFTGE